MKKLFKVGISKDGYIPMEYANKILLKTLYLCEIFKMDEEKDIVHKIYIQTLNTNSKQKKFKFKKEYEDLIIGICQITRQKYDIKIKEIFSLLKYESEID
jgi:hypothetical protein